VLVRELYGLKRNKSDGHGSFALTPICSKQQVQALITSYPGTVQLSQGIRDKILIESPPKSQYGHLKVIETL